MKSDRDCGVFRILTHMPARLRLTGDFSHWILVSERFLDSAADNHKLQTAISHVSVAVPLAGTATPRFPIMERSGVTKS